MSTATLTPVKQEQFSAEFIHELRVKPQDNLRVFLGSFDLAEKLKGFVIEVSPSTIPTEAVNTHISRMDGEANTKYFLDIANKGARSIKARIRKI